MFVKVSDIVSPKKCRVLAWEHTRAKIERGFKIVTQEDFITKYMSKAGRIDLLGSEDCNNPEVIKAKVDRWFSQTKIKERIFFSGTTMDMAINVAQRVLFKAQIPVDFVDAIIGATNTGPGYPSLADHVKLALGSVSSKAVCFDVTEACTASAVAIFNAWNLIRSGVCKCVLVVCSEKATTLARPDNWIEANLFGDGAFAVVLVADNFDSFEFFDGHCMPFGGNLHRVVKTEDGFKQDGKNVHKFVGREVVRTVVEAVQKAELSYSDICHLVPHQPSGKTLKSLSKKICQAWPDFTGQIHNVVENTGNLSSASTGWVISEQIDRGVIRPGDLVVVVTFGSGLAIFSYAMRI